MLLACFCVFAPIKAMFFAGPAGPGGARSTVIQKVIKESKKIVMNVDKENKLKKCPKEFKDFIAASSSDGMVDGRWPLDKWLLASMPEERVIEAVDQKPEIFLDLNGGPKHLDAFFRSSSLLPLYYITRHIDIEKTNDKPYDLLEKIVDKHLDDSRDLMFACQQKTGQEKTHGRDQKVEASIEGLRKIIGSKKIKEAALRLDDLEMAFTNLVTFGATLNMKGCSNYKNIIEKLCDLRSRNIPFLTSSFCEQDVDCSYKNDSKFKLLTIAFEQLGPFGVNQQLKSLKGPAYYACGTENFAAVKLLLEYARGSDKDLLGHFLDDPEKNREGVMRLIEDREESESSKGDLYPEINCTWALGHYTSS